MDIGKVIGTIVATRKDPSLVGSRLLVVQPLDAEGGSIGDPVTAVDIQGAAGYGELVYTVTGGDAAFVSAERAMPVDVAVVGIVDSITVTEGTEE
ncbi:ethanolamine utilization protein EutN [Candidatus Poribacteria bacterium]|nr:ethanolamine utilization protein EutN [Candidatus Poribacteria bacterium]